MLKPTSCKEALERWREQHQKNPKDAKEVILSFQWPPIEKMDNSLSQLISVELLIKNFTKCLMKHSNISGINTLKNLKILSLSRNNIKNFSGLEALGDHLEELWISYNIIEKLRGANSLKALKILYIGNNLIKDWTEFNRLQDLPNLIDLLFINNPLCESMEPSEWREQVIKKLPNLIKLDSVPVVSVSERV